jgi:hypothetical protein
MFTGFFRSRTPRPNQPESGFRPLLENLEDRMALSAMMGPGDDHGPPHGPPPGHQPPPPPAHTSASGDNNGSLNGSLNHSTITGSFNGSFNTTVTNNYVLMPMQQAATQTLSMYGSLLGMGLNMPQLGSLVNEEIGLAVDKYLLQANIGNSSSLQADINNLTAAISSNPAEHNPFGSLIGSVTYDLTYNALVTTQAGI